jgi:serine protease AprX
MRHSRANNLGDRSNALWGRGSRGEQRSNALWGRGGRRAGVATAMVVVFAMASVAGAGLASHSDGNGKYGNLKTYVPDTLLSAIQQNPAQSFDVILQGDRKQGSHGFIQKILNDRSGSSDENVRGSDLKQEFNAISGGQFTLTGKQILRIAKNGIADSIVPDETVKLQGSSSGIDWTQYNTQLWPYASTAAVDWFYGASTKPTIAIVDSGIQTPRADFGNRVIKQVSMSSLGSNASGDSYGHGTFVAGIAAGSAPGYFGAAPGANLLSIDVINDQGQSTVADVIKACDWILANKNTYNIKVANFSLHAVNRASVMFDPLDQAVEKLWLNGVTVVAAAGNYGDGTPSGVRFAPGNDPFVITVGAADIGTTMSTADDTTAPFSAYGFTGDGFWKPELGAPGRYIVGPVPAGSVLTQEKPANVTAPGYMRLSGTSFAAPVVSAAAAMLAAQYPTWGPDQIKGALMATATPESNVTDNGLGVGMVNVYGARVTKFASVPNPNKGLDQFVTSALDGTRVFDATAWHTAALANVAWNDVAWSDVAWSDVAWSDVAWSDVAWADAAWATAAWGDVAWSDVAWSDAAWADAAWADNADSESAGNAVVKAAPADLSSALSLMTGK